MREDIYTNGFVRKPCEISNNSPVLRTKPLKVTTVGDGLVGKTCMLVTYALKEFPQEYVPTVFDNFPTNLTVDGMTHNVTLWDTAGQEDYERLRPLTYTDTDCFLVCFSISSRTSYDNVAQKWYPELKHHCPNVPIILIGTKKDLRGTGEEVISFQEGKKLQRKIQAENYMECSALKNQGLHEVMTESVRSAVRKFASRKRNCCIL